jgi:hypothetical protein
MSRVPQGPSLASTKEIQGLLNAEGPWPGS